MINWSQAPILLILRYHVLVDQFVKHIMNHANKTKHQIENKVPKINNLVIKAALNKRAAETESKKAPKKSGFITTPELNKLTKMKECKNERSSKS